jgi:T5orf172 domain
MKPIPFMSIYRGWPPRDRGGYVYLVRCNGNPPRYKVGRTLNPSERFATIRNQNAYECDALAIGYVRKPLERDGAPHNPQARGEASQGRVVRAGR